MSAQNLLAAVVLRRRI